MFVLEDNVFRIPIYTNNNPTVVFYKDGEVIASETFNTEDLSADQIKYVSIYGDDVNWDTYQERVLNENGTYEDSSCLQSFFNSYSIGAVDKITVSGNSYGNELVSNGNFETDTSWSILVGDTISNGKLNISGQGARTSDTFLPVVGKNWLLTFDITDYTSGYIRAYDGSGGINLTGDLNAIGSYSFSYTQSSAVIDNLNFYTPTDFVGSISNVTVKEYYGETTDIIKVNVH